MCVTAAALTRIAVTATKGSYPVRDRLSLSPSLCLSVSLLLYQSTNLIYVSPSLSSSLSFSPSVRYKYISRARRHSGRARYENQRRYRSASGYVISAAILSTGNYSRGSATRISVCSLARSQPSPVILPGRTAEKCGIIARDRARKLSGACVCSCTFSENVPFPFFSLSSLSFSWSLFPFLSLSFSLFLSFSFLYLSFVDRLMSLSAIPRRVHCAI